MLREANDSYRLTVELILAETVLLDTKRKVNKTKYVK